MTNIVPISQDEFTGKSWRRSQGFLFSANDMVCPLSLEEIPRAMRGMPLAFTRENDQYSIVAVLGLQEDVNFFVSSEGKWRGNYIPALYRAYPFVLAENEAQEGQFVLCFSQDSGLLAEDDSAEPFFGAEDQLSETVAQIRDFLAKVQTGRTTCNAMCRVLDELDLIVPWELNIQVEDGNRRLEGLYQVSEDALNQLSDEDFLRVRNSGALPVIYSQLLSMQTMLELLRIAQTLSEAQSESALDDLNFGDADASQNISFDNL